MRASASLLALALILGVAISCKLSERLAGDKNAGTVSELWSDVPPFQGATKADLEIPLGVRLLIRGMIARQGELHFLPHRQASAGSEGLLFQRSHESRRLDRERQRLHGRHRRY